MINVENIHRDSIIWIEQVVFRNIYVSGDATISKKKKNTETINLEGAGGGYMGGFGRIKGWGEML